MRSFTTTDRSDLPVLREPHGTARAVQAIVSAPQSLEGGGFTVFRPFPQPGAQLADTDPFLMLDEMGPADYAPGEAVGAPDHPHRGFETVTYLLDGEFVHRDSTGGGGLLRGGDTQWMTAGAGLVHSEMPTERIMRDGGRVHGLQLWVNLPRAAKMTPPRYQDLTADTLTYLATADGCGVVRLIAGDLDGHSGPGSTHTPIVYAHVSLDAGGRFAVAWPDVCNALVYVLDGAVRVGGDTRAVRAHQLAVLSREGDDIVIDADTDAECIVIGGRPFREPIAWYGPFVMNTKQEILDAIDDFQAGRLGAIPPEQDRSSL